MNITGDVQDIGFGDLDDEQLDLYLMTGLNLLGWTSNFRYTTEDSFLLFDLCKRTFLMRRLKTLSPEKIDELSLEAYELLSFQVTNPIERADWISTCYFNSSNIRPLITLIDEAMLSFYRGYYLASLSIMLITLEKYLRIIFKPTEPDERPSFNNLKNSILSLPNEYHAQIAYENVSILYSHYDSSSPTQFFFNRHGLLHGLRGNTKYDQMNCARVFMLFDELWRAEDGRRTAYGDCLEMFKYRSDIYSECQEQPSESKLLSIYY